MPQPIYLPADPSGFGPMMSGFAESFGQAYLMKKKKEEEANKMLLNILMEYGGQISPEQMGQIEGSMGFGQSPIGKIGGMLGISPEPKPSPLRGLFEPAEPGFRIKGKEERGLETFRKQREIEEPFIERREERGLEAFKKQKEIEQPFEIGKEERGEKREKRLTQFRTEEDIRGELLKIDQLTGKKRQVALDDLRAQLELVEKMEGEFFSKKLERLKQEKTAMGDVATAQAIDQLQKEAPIKWEQLKKEIELRGQEARKTEQVKLQKQATKEDVAAAKEKKANYLKTLSNINSAFAKWPGEEITDDELEKITRLAETQGWQVISVPISKSRLGMDWAAKDKYTFQIVDPETGMPPKVYEEKETKTAPKITEPSKKPDWIVDPKTGKVMRNK